MKSVRVNFANEMMRCVLAGTAFLLVSMSFSTAAQQNTADATNKTEELIASTDKLRQQL